VGKRKERRRDWDGRGEKKDRTGRGIMGAIGWNGLPFSDQSYVSGFEQLN